MITTLSKAYDLADLADLPFVGPIKGQHALRTWEYAMALAAFDRWGGRTSTNIIDVGGAGSPLWHLLQVGNAKVVDPAEGVDLETYLSHNPPLASAVFCVSVLEHVVNLDRFLYHLGCLVAPGGLLFLTMDYQPDESPDDKMFHWMRERIGTPSLIRVIHQILKDHSCLDLGNPPDWTYHGDCEQLGYSSASLALVKRS